MKDLRTTKKVKYIAISLWATVGILFVIAWTLLLTVHPDFEVPGMFAITGTVLAVAAGATTIRMYLLQNQRLIRLAAGLIYDDRQDKAAARVEEARHLKSVP